MARGGGGGGHSPAGRLAALGQEGLGAALGVGAGQVSSDALLQPARLLGQLVPAGRGRGRGWGREECVEAGGAGLLVGAGPVPLLLFKVHQELLFLVPKAVSDCRRTVVRRKAATTNKRVPSGN